MNDKRPNSKLEEKVIIPFDHPSVVDTTTWKMWKCPVGKSFVVDRVSYINPTGLVGDIANNFSGALKKGATVMATLFNTDTDAGGASLAANTFVEGALSATVAATWLAAGDELSLTVTEGGVATLPAGRLVVEGRLL